MGRNRVRAPKPFFECDPTGGTYYSEGEPCDRCEGECVEYEARGDRDRVQTCRACEGEGFKLVELEGPEAVTAALAEGLLSATQVERLLGEVAA